VVANQTAWNAIALAPIAPLGAVTTLVTGNSLADDAQAIARATVGELHLVDVDVDVDGNVSIGLAGAAGTRFLSDAVH
jgi:hypothetical protein